MDNSYYYAKPRPPYLLGLLCLIPLIGFFVGLVMLILGLTKYKDKWFTAIGVLGMLFTIGIYGSMFYFAFKSNAGKNAFAEFAQMQLNTLVRDIEFYKLEKGKYPDRLEQLIEGNKMTNIYDPMYMMNPKPFNYQNLDSNYTLFSNGVDGIPNTKDDLFPEINGSDSSKIGFIKLN
jgi:Type II secretion system (T2SS), protein G